MQEGGDKKEKSPLGASTKKGNGEIKEGREASQCRRRWGRKITNSRDERGQERGDVARRIAKGCRAFLNPRTAGSCAAKRTRQKPLENRRNQAERVPNNTMPGGEVNAIPSMQRIPKKKKIQRQPRGKHKLRIAKPKPNKSQLRKVRKTRRVTGRQQGKRLGLKTLPGISHKRGRPLESSGGPGSTTICFKEDRGVIEGKRRIKQGRLKPAS